MKKINYEIGQRLSLEMLPANKPGQTLPIARTDSGVIAFIAPGTLGHFPINSIWDCKVVKIMEKCIWVIPVEILVTAAANEYAAHQKLMKAWGQKPAKVKKEKPHYQYSSKVELLKSKAA